MGCYEKEESSKQNFGKITTYVQLEFSKHKSGYFFTRSKKEPGIIIRVETSFLLSKIVVSKKKTQYLCRKIPMYVLSQCPLSLLLVKDDSSLLRYSAPGISMLGLRFEE